MPPTIPSYPGVYIEESPGTVHGIEGVPTSIAAFVGRATCGPTNQPTCIDSFLDFERLFGGLALDCPLSYSVRDFFINGGSHAIVVRVSSGGIDSGPITDPAVYVPTDGSKNGIYALEDTPVFNLLCIPPDTPGWSSTTPFYTVVYPLALAYCKKRLAVLLMDPPSDWLTASDAIAGLSRLGLATNGDYGAIYFPQLIEPDPLREGQSRVVPPSGAVAGVIAKTDSARGVWKAPAGVSANLVGIEGLSLSLTDDENGRLNALGINCLRSFVDRGNVVWGSRTLQGAEPSDYEFVNIRRLALFIEASLLNGIQWVVFEPNDEPLWAQIRLSIQSFMLGLFRQGAFQGPRPQDAFFFKCDSETTTASDQSTGVVNIVVGFAPQRPAEFVVVQIQQLAGQSCI